MAISQDDWRRCAVESSRPLRRPVAIRSDVTLISVSKTHPAEVVDEIVIAGARDLGENRVQEAQAKKPGVRAARWHLIGPLQRNKARAALEVFDVIHTVDRPEIGDRLQFLLEEHWPQRVMEVLLEINVGSEPQKAGVIPADARELLEAVRGHDRLAVTGIMAIPPYAADPKPRDRTIAGCGNSAIGCRTRRATRCRSCPWG